MKFYYRRKLPHIVPKDSIFFITSRLAGSLPADVIERLKKSYKVDLDTLSTYKNVRIKKQRYTEIKQNYFESFDTALDKFSEGPFWLGQDSIAQIVADALHFRDKKIYNLYAYTIMSNHIHKIIKPLVGQDDILSYNKSGENTIGRKVQSEYLLGDIMESFKRFTALKCNRVLKRRGAFWQHVNYDHVVRDYEELIRLINYILNNPVKAGLIDSPNKWKWSYYNSDLL